MEGEQASGRCQWQRGERVRENGGGSGSGKQEGGGD